MKIIFMSFFFKPETKRSSQGQVDKKFLIFLRTEPVFVAINWDEL
eukprot:UN26995